MGNVFGLKSDPRIKGSCALCHFPISDDPEVQAQQQTCRCGPVGRKALSDVWAGDRTTLEPTGNPEIRDYGKVDSVVISGQHAFSLVRMVQWFRDMIMAVELPECPRRSDELTTAYCDELLEDLAKDPLGTRRADGAVFIHKTAPESDIVDGKATRDLKKGEAIWLTPEDLLILRCTYQKRRDQARAVMVEIDKDEGETVRVGVKEVESLGYRPPGRLE